MEHRQSPVNKNIDARQNRMSIIRWQTTKNKKKPSISITWVENQRIVQQQQQQQQRSAERMCSDVGDSRGLRGCCLALRRQLRTDSARAAMWSEGNFPGGYQTTVQCNVGRKSAALPGGARRKDPRGRAAFSNRTAPLTPAPECFE